MTSEVRHGRLGELAYLDQGPLTAPALLLCNSLGTNTSVWDGQLEVWGRYLRVIRYDLPGHGASGLSEADYSLERLGADALSLLDTLGLKQVALCGLSLGGMVAARLASAAPHRVSRLVLACSAASFPPPESWRERAALVRARGLASLTPTLSERWFSSNFWQDHAEQVAAATAMLSTVGDEGYARCCEVLVAADLSSDLGSIRVPTLVLAGAEDAAIPAGASLALWAAIPKAAFRILPGAGHLANLERPREFADAVLDQVLGSGAERGGRSRRRVLGDRHVDRAQGSANELTRDFHDLATRFAWAEVWSRPGLDQRTRRLLTLAMLVAMGRLEELEMHLRAALGELTVAEVRECLLQAAVYCGLPAANAAFKVADRVLGEERRDG
ncbi:MAG: alpha/beta fold hydrolase [Streptosporangiaceae bacterium]